MNQLRCLRGLRVAGTVLIIFEISQFLTPKTTKVVANDYFKITMDNNLYTTDFSTAFL